MGDVSVDARLDLIREKKDCQLWPCDLITEEFRSIPPHRVGIAHLMFRPRFVLADPVGCGKTPQALIAFAQLKVKRQKIRLLVVTIDSAYYQWAEQALAFLNTLTVTVVGLSPRAGKGKQAAAAEALRANPRVWSGDTRGSHDKPAALRATQYSTSPADIFVTTWDQMVRDIDVLMEQPWIGDTIVVFDEIAEKARSWTQKTFHPCASRLSLKAMYAWGLTATPIMRRIDDLYGIYGIIRPGMLGDSHNEFRLIYYELELKRIRTRQGWKRFYEPLEDANGRPIIKNIPQLQRLIRPYFLKRPASEINEYLPKITPPKVIRVEMGKEQRAFYNKVVDRWFHPQREIASKDQRIQQIAAIGYAQMASDTPESLGEGGVPSAKMEALIRFLKEEAVDEKFIIFTRYTQVLHCITQRLRQEGFPNVEIHGELSKDEKQTARKAFWDDPAVKGMGITTAGGQALNLQVARILIFFDLPWTWGSYVQLLGRVRRMGSKYPRVFPVLLINSDTIDEDTVTIVKSEKSLVDDTLGLDDDEKLQFTSEFTGTITGTSIDTSPLVDEAIAESVDVAVESSVAALYDAVRRRL